MTITLMNPWIFLGLVAAAFGALWYLLCMKRSIYYSYPLGQFLKNTHYQKIYTPYWLALLRCAILLLLAFIVARPQLVDVSWPLKAQGIDIMLVLDVSGSMQALDDLHDPRMRIEIAKTEAMNFIDRRAHDQIGLVLFGKQVFSRCPLTLDKSILKAIIADTHLGTIDGEGTLLGCGMLTAANRLKRSKARSKIMIVLTDGQPTPGDISHEEVIEIAKKFGIKIYTIGIGSSKGSYVQHPLFGLITVETPLNQGLLEHVAQQTGGSFFLASNSQELNAIYKQIDMLEKSEQEAPIFYKQYDFFKPFLMLLLFLLAVELLVSMSIWFIV